MKRLIFGLLYITTCGSYAQEYRISEVATTLHLVLGSASVEIQGSERKGISIVRTNRKKTNPRADGLVQVGKGTDNTGVGMNRRDSQGVIVLEELSQKSKNSFVIHVPRNIKLVVEETWWSGKGIEVKDIHGGVTISSNNASVLIDRVMGPIEIKSISGDITGTFVNIESDITMHSISGAVVARVNKAANADLELETISGSISTNLNIEPKLDPKYGMLRQIGHGRKLKAKLNEGGSVIAVSTISGSANIITISQQ